ncbi:O-antigen ligase family protein [Bdellovibrio sp. HCB290]|uniref:O-antigen ligase family protein n=1 Tax=Bdellovibrio sp. HCB290 TaxID=3394356 RepID=UPI0039B569B3
MEYSQPKWPIESESKISRNIWLSLWALFAVSMFVSKSGISIFGTILLLWSLFKINWKATIRQNYWFAVLLSIYPLAILVSLLSIAGLDAALKVAREWAWPLYIIPFSLLFQDKKGIKVFSWGSAIGLIAAFIKAIVLFGSDWHWALGSQTRVASFWDISRWGYFLSCSSVVLFALIGHSVTWSKMNRLQKVALPLLLVCSLVFLVLSNTRGPWLATFLGLAALGVSGKRYFKMLCAFAVFVVLSLVVTPGVLDRLESSFSAKTENGVVTSKDASNAGRLHMWQVNLEMAQENLFFGTGFESVEKPLREFIEKKGTEYRNRYVFSEFSFRDQHSSYLQILVQLGIVFFVFFWGVVGILVLLSFRAFFKSQDVWVKTAFALTVTQLFMFIFYSSISSFEGLWFYPTLLVLSAAVMQHKAKLNIA